jgi:hypothetical protein
MLSADTSNGQQDDATKTSLQPRARKANAAKSQFEEETVAEGLRQRAVQRAKQTRRLVPYGH